MKLIVGLGNPGDKYKYTRHNIGFMIVEQYVKDELSLSSSLKAWKEDKHLSSLVCKEKDFIVIKPQTYMNLSGLAVSRTASYYKIKEQDIIVVHDDIDLPLGKIRIRKGGASAGHRGIESIIEHFGNSDFVRLRLGIGRGKLNINKSTDQNLHGRSIEKYVVSLFKQDEASEVKHMTKRATDALKTLVEDGLEKAMNRFN